MVGDLKGCEECVLVYAFTEIPSSLGVYLLVAGVRVSLTNKRPNVLKLPSKRKAK